MKGKIALFVFSVVMALPLRAELRAGTEVTDITPEKLPVLVNGSFLTRSADTVKTRLHARTLVLDDGKSRVAMVVVDSCMMPRLLLDQAKRLAEEKTGIPADRILIAATHTHSAASCMGALGTDADPDYVSFLRKKLVESIASAARELQPVRVGWAVGDAAEMTAVRRWIFRPDSIENDPFGNPTVRATMHAARKGWDKVTGPSGPEDPDLSMISLQTEEGKPFAVFASFSMHYFGDEALSADYFGLFCEGLKNRLAGEEGDFVALLSHGCSGDTWRKDYMLPGGKRGEKETIGSYTSRLLDVAESALSAVEHREDVDLAMAERRLRLNYRVPDQQRVEWAEGIVEKMGDRPPRDRTEVYAREQIILHKRGSTDVVVQALRIGDIGIATTPTETYALTGLKIKGQSPLRRTMVLDLTNGGDGYIPPPEQHFLGGYNTWPARSAGLEITAEPRITEAALQLLEEVSDDRRRPHAPIPGAGSEVIMGAGPVAYWRLEEFAGPFAVDAAGFSRDAIYEPGVVFFLEGPRSDVFRGDGLPNRCAHFAGGRLRSRIEELGNHYTISLWFWNGMPVDARETAGWIFSRDRDQGLGKHSDHLGVGGSGDLPGRLVYQHGDLADGGVRLVGKSSIERWSWNHAVLVRSGDAVRVHLNGVRRPEIESEVAAGTLTGPEDIFFGGRSDNRSNWEGRLDEIAIFDRAFSLDEVTRLYPKGRAR